MKSLERAQESASVFRVSAMVITVGLDLGSVHTLDFDHEHDDDACRVVRPHGAYRDEKQSHETTLETSFPLRLINARKASSEWAPAHAQSKSYDDSCC